MQRLLLPLKEMMRNMHMSIYTHNNKVLQTCESAHTHNTKIVWKWLTFILLLISECASIQVQKYTEWSKNVRLLAVILRKHLYQYMCWGTCDLVLQWMWVWWETYLHIIFYWKCIYRSYKSFIYIHTCITTHMYI